MPVLLKTGLQQALFFILKFKERTGNMTKSRTVAPGIRQRGKSYTFTVAMGMTPEGKQIRKTTTWHPPKNVTPGKADKLAIEAYYEFKGHCNGMVSLNENMRFSDLADEYFRVYAPNKLKATTTYSYQSIANHRLLPHFGNKKLKEITNGSITAFLNSITSTHANGEKAPAAKNTVKNIYTALRSIFHYAETQNYIKETPCKNVILPATQEEEKRRYLTEEEIPLFLELFDGYSPLNTIVKILLYTGMRSGECIALQWEDIDFNNNIIYISHTLAKIKGKRYRETPKSRTSKRYVFMSSVVKEALKEHRKHQILMQMAAGDKFKYPEMVFTTSTGNYINHSHFDEAFKKRLQNTPFDFITPHCLRHCNATLLLNEGVDLKIVSEHLGHSNISTTANIYTDVLASSKKKTADIVELKLAR